MLTFHLGEVLLHFAGASFAMQGHLQHNHLSNFPELSSDFQSKYMFGALANFEQKPDTYVLVAAVLKTIAADCNF